MITILGMIAAIAIVFIGAIVITMAIAMGTPAIIVLVIVVALVVLDIKMFKKLWNNIFHSNKKEAK